MKKLGFLTTLLFSAIIALNSCEEGVNGDNTPTPCNNTTFACAKEVNLGESTMDNFEGSDRKYFSYELTESNGVTIDLWPVPSDKKIRFNMYTEDDQEFHSWSTYYRINDQPGQRVTGWVIAPVGKYFVEVRSDYPTEDFTITVTESEDKHEWNQTCVNSSAIALNDTIEARIFGVTVRGFDADDDYFVFEVEEEGNYKIDFTEVPQIEKSMIYRLYRGLGCNSDMGWWTNNAGFPFSNVHYLQPNTYYIKVDISGDWGSGTPYKFVISKQ